MTSAVGPTVSELEMSELNAGSVTAWLQPLKAGDPAAAEYVWSRYFQRSLQLARQRLGGLSDTARDAEDVALSAMNALFLAARNPGDQGLKDRNDLWRLLSTCTLNRTRNLLRDSLRLKRSGGGDVPALSDEQVECELLEKIDKGLDPADAVMFADEMGKLLDLLDAEDPSQRLRQVALWKLDGCTDREVAVRMNCTRKTVCARLALIRALWKSVGQS